MQPRLNAGSELFSPAVAAVPLPKRQIPALVGVCKDSFAAQIVFGLLCLTAARGSDPLTKKEIPLLQPGSAELFWVPIRGTNETKLDAFHLVWMWAPRNGNLLSAGERCGVFLCFSVRFKPALCRGDEKRSEFQDRQRCGDGRH